MKTTAKNLQLWEQRITERVQNRLTVGEWCKKNGVSKHQYYYWNHRVQEKKRASEDTTFADITPILSAVDPARQNPVTASDFQIYIKSIRITVPSDFNPGSLAGLMKVLQEL